MNAGTWRRLVALLGDEEARHWLNERAAIREYCGEQARPEAERGAWDDARDLINALDQVTSK